MNLAGHKEPKLKGRPSSRRLLILALVGSLLGFLAESIHQRAGVWTPAQGSGLPLWITAVYLVGLGLAGFAFSLLERRLPPRILTQKTLMLEVMLLGALFLLPPLLHCRELLLLLVATAYLLARLLLIRWPGDLLVAAFAIALDLIIEGTLVSFSLYSYANAQWLPLPLWLAPLWGCLGLGLRRIFFKSPLPIKSSPPDD